MKKIGINVFITEGSRLTKESSEKAHSENRGYI